MRDFTSFWKVDRLLILLAVVTTSCAFTTPDSSSVEGKEKIISFGEKVNLEDHLVKGKTVIFDFYSEYCPPCRQIGPKLVRLAEKRNDLVVVKVNINRKDVSGIDWRSPVAIQFALQSIPHFKIYSPEGKLVAEGENAYSQVLTMMQKEGIS